MQRPIRKYAPIFILPTFLAFIIGFVWPFIQGIYLSFCNFNTPKDAKWVGINNYLKVFSDAGFINAFKNTAAFAIVSIILINVIAFMIAYALTQKIRGANLFRTVFFMPNLIGGIVLGWLWQVLINGVLAKYGVTIVTNEWYGFWSLILVMTWQQLGYMMIIYISGLQSIPEELMEAASIDGANAWQTLRFVKLPMLMPSITICTFLTITNGFKLFDQNLALTNGMPPESRLMALDIYNTFYGRTGWAGAGQAKAVVFCIIVVAIALLQQKLTHSKEVQQ